LLLFLDVLEENFQNEKYCELVWRILTEKKRQVTEIAELERVSVSVSAQNDTASSGSGGDLHEIDSSDSVRDFKKYLILILYSLQILTRSNLLCLLQDKTLSTTLPDSDTSSAKLALDDDENTSSISDAQTAQTVQIRDSSNDDTEDIEPETRLMPHETAANDPLTVEVCRVFLILCHASMGILYHGTLCFFYDRLQKMQIPLLALCWKARLTKLKNILVHPWLLTKSLIL